MSDWARQEKSTGRTIGFVPTMGALHRGHLSLVSRAGMDNDLVICSIFVNPIQFNNPQDLKKYPRTPERDLRLLREAGCTAVFCPSGTEMYPGPVTTTYDFGQLDKVMEGRFREGHFNGVAIVVNELLDVVGPDRAYFGQKDFQQLQIVKALARKEHPGTEIIGCPTVREDDGLALSSRNARLSEQARREAPCIYRALQMARDSYPHTPIGEIKKQLARYIETSPQLKLEYFDIVWADSLMPVERPDPSRQVVGCIAAYAGKVRLIDNLAFNS